MDGEASRALEPTLVIRTREGLQKREAVAGRAVAEAVTLLVAVGARLPRELGAREEQILVQVVHGCGDDSRGAVAPLQPDHGVVPLESPARERRPSREPSFDDRFASENALRITPQRRSRLPDLRERVDIADQTVHRAEKAVCLAVQALTPEAVLVT